MDDAIVARLRKVAFGRDRITDVERVAMFLGDDTPEGALIRDAAEVLALLRVAVRGGSLEPPVRNWNK